MRSMLCFGAHRDIMALSLKANEDGTFVLYTGAHDMGNGSVTMQTQMVSSVLGVRVEDIESVESDTDLVPYNLADYGSRGVYVEGSAAKKVAETMKQKLAEKASNFLDCATDEVEFADRSVYVKNDPERKLTMGELIRKTQREDEEEILASESYHSSSGPFSFGVHFAEVWVNEELHKVKVVDYVAVHDVGKVINRAGIEGQAEGGIEMGIGYALSEGVYFDDTGRMINSNLKNMAGHKRRYARNLKIDFIEKNEPTGLTEGKRIGECATVPPLRQFLQP